MRFRFLQCAFLNLHSYHALSWSLDDHVCACVVTKWQISLISSSVYFSEEAGFCDVSACVAHVAKYSKDKSELFKNIIYLFDAMSMVNGE